MQRVAKYHVKGHYAGGSREAVQLCLTAWWSVAEPAAHIDTKNDGPRRGPIWIHLHRPLFAVGPLRGPWLAHHINTAGSATLHQAVRHS